MRSTPTPGACIKARHCLSQTGDCHCDALASDSPVISYEQMARAVLVLLIAVLLAIFGVAFQVYSLLPWDSLEAWFSTLVQSIPALPALPPETSGARSASALGDLLASTAQTTDNFSQGNSNGDQKPK